jgi:hypothetical protein
MYLLQSINGFKKQIVGALVAAMIVCSAQTAQAISFGKPGGAWPKTWPQELEKFRKEAWTWKHGFGGMSYDIPFASKEDFEAAWPHIVKLKSKGASITLRRGTHLRILSSKTKAQKSAGVIIRLPREGTTTGVMSETRIELIVDGKIIDLNRIPLPVDTKIIDLRFVKKSK